MKTRSVQVSEDVKDEALAVQEAKLRDHPLLRRFAESRRKLAADPYRPLYHFVTPESTLNDPNGLGVEPAGDIASLRGAHRHLGEIALPANQEVVLEGVQCTRMRSPPSLTSVNRRWLN